MNAVRKRVKNVEKFINLTTDQQAAFSTSTFILFPKLHTYRNTITGADNNLL